MGPSLSTITLAVLFDLAIPCVMVVLVFGPIVLGYFLRRLFVRARRARATRPVVRHQGETTAAWALRAS
jgi:hypothetical protein